MWPYSCLPGFTVSFCPCTQFIFQIATIISLQKTYLTMSLSCLKHSQCTPQPVGEGPGLLRWPSSPLMGTWQPHRPPLPALNFVLLSPQGAWSVSSQHFPPPCSERFYSRHSFLLTPLGWVGCPTSALL